MELQNERNTFSKEKYNKAKFGFFPTDPGLIEMMMRAVDFRKDQEITVADFGCGEGDQLLSIVEYAMKNEANVTGYGIEIAAERAMKAAVKVQNRPISILNEDVFYVSLRSDDDRLDCLSLLYCNPPYFWTADPAGKKIRTEDLFMMEITKYLAPGGLIIYTIPSHQLSEGLAKKLAYRYDNLNILRFPDGEYKKYKQIVIYGTKKLKGSSDVENAKRLLALAHDSMNITTLDCMPSDMEKFYKLPSCRPLAVFKSAVKDVNTLGRALHSVENDLKECVKRKCESKIKFESSMEPPLLPLSAGHMAIVLASGKFNGVLNNLLIKGGCYKEIDTKVEIENAGTRIDEKTIRTETVKTYVEVTNAVGEIIILS